MRIHKQPVTYIISSAINWDFSSLTKAFMIVDQLFMFWPGPKLLEQFVIIPGKPNVRYQEVMIKSDAALLAE